MKLKNSKNQYPKVEIKGQLFVESAYSTYGFIYEAPKMYAWAKYKKYKEFDFPLCCLTITDCPFKIHNFKDFLEDCKRVEDASLEYPILLDPDGYICDGWHRAAKAMLLGKTTIRAIKLEELPEPSRKEEDNN